MIPGSKIINVAGILLVLLISGCKPDKKLNAFHFTQMPFGHTHIDFDNRITESDSVNVFVDEYMYNGSGVGIGDFNNDGLPDVFFLRQYGKQ